uniref:UBX domain-containing protein n=1 Tax=Caenorhabditis tropicalis TaxID=1561998 RepID=A0A1I7USQ4_9PELO
MMKKSKMEKGIEKKKKGKKKEERRSKEKTTKTTTTTTTKGDSEEDVEKKKEEEPKEKRKLKDILLKTAPRTVRNLETGGLEAKRCDTWQRFWTRDANWDLWWVTLNLVVVSISSMIISVFFIPHFLPESEWETEYWMIRVLTMVIHIWCLSSCLLKTLLLIPFYVFWGISIGANCAIFAIFATSLAINHISIILFIHLLITFSSLLRINIVFFFLIIRTFRDIGGDNDGPDSDDSGADTERGQPQEFYAGSGQAVQGPRGAPRHGGAEDHIRRILQAAQVENPEEMAAAMRGGRGGEKITLTLHLWIDGLSIDDGPLMPRNEPATNEFLEIVGRGGIPPMLLQKYPGKDIDFNIDRRTHEQYQPPKMKAFGGNGVRLGNVVPNVTGEGSSASGAPAPAPAVSEEQEQSQMEQAKKELNTDLAQPTTNVQIRLPNSQRLVGVFNHTHTLEHVRTFICTARPDMIYQPFEMMSAYPPKVLLDENQTLKEANLLNAVIAVRISASN